MKSENLTVNEVTLKAIGGTEVLDCIKDAMIYAIKHMETKVFMSHNGIKIRINLELHYDKYYKEWNSKLQEASDKAEKERKSVK